MKKLQLVWLAAAFLAAGAAHAAGPYAWVLHPTMTVGTSSLIKLNARTGAQLATITFPNGYLTPGDRDIVSASPDGRWVAITGSAVAVGFNGADLILVNTKTDAVSMVNRTWTGSNDASGVTWAPDSSVLYVMAGAAPYPQKVYAVNPAAPALDTTIGSQTFPPERLFSSADGRHILLALYATAPDHVLDLTTGQWRSLGAPISNGNNGIGATSADIGTIAAAPDGRFYYIYVDASGTEYLVRLTLGTDAASDQVDMLPIPACDDRAVAVSPDNTRAYVTNGSCTNDPGLLVFDLKNFTELAPITLPSRTTAVDVTSDGQTVLALMPDLSKMAAIDVASGKMTFQLLTDSSGATMPGSLIGTGIMIGGASGAATAVAVNPANPQFVYTGIDGQGVYVSNDGGQSWAMANTGLTDLDVTALVVTSNGAAIYAGTRHGGVFKSNDNGAHWQALNTGLDPHICSLVISPNDNQVIYAGIAGGGGVYKTTDGGQNWQAMNAGLP